MQLPVLILKIYNYDLYGLLNIWRIFSMKRMTDTINLPIWNKINAN